METKATKRTIRIKPKTRRSAKKKKMFIQELWEKLDQALKGSK